MSAKVNSKDPVGLEMVKQRNESKDVSIAPTTPTGRIAPTTIVRRLGLAIAPSAMLLPGIVMDLTAQPSENPEACLVALPNELLVEIARFLKRKDLFSLGMVSRNFSIIAMPLVYAEGIDPSMSQESRATFASRIDNKSTLARLVKKIHFRYAFSKPTRFQRGVGPNGEAPGSLVLNEKLAAIHDSATERELETLAMAMIAAMDVEELNIEDRSHRSTEMHHTDLLYWVHLIYQGATAMPSWTQPFLHLRVLKVCFSPTVAGWISLEHFLPVITLPCIEELQLQGFIETQPPKSWDCTPKSSNLKIIVLQGTFLHWQIVSWLVQSCKALEHFVYTYVALMSTLPGFHPPGFHPNADWAPHSWAGIGHALQTQKNSLRGLEIAYLVHRAQLLKASRLHPVWAWQIGTLGSFVDFPVLKRLNVPVDALIPSSIRFGARPTYLAECLPVGLETLSMRYDGITELAEVPCIENIVAVVVSNKKAGRKLQRLHLSLSEEVRFQQYSIAGCREAGLSLFFTRSRVHWFTGRTVYRGG